MFSAISASNKLLLLTSVISLTISVRQAEAFTIYMEDFNDPADQGKGAVGVNSSTSPVIDTSGVDWTIDVSNANLTASSDFFRVQNNQFEAQDVDGEAIWSSPVIDISSFSDVSFAIDFSELGELEETGSVNADYVDVTYILDGATFSIPNQNGVVGAPNVGQHTLLGDFGSQTISQTGLSGTNLQLNVAIRNLSLIHI